MGTFGGVYVGRISSTFYSLQFTFVMYEINNLQLVNKICIVCLLFSEVILHTSGRDTSRLFIFFHVVIYFCIILRICII